jgi:hypothetical protein
MVRRSPSNQTRHGRLGLVEGAVPFAACSRPAWGGAVARRGAA